MADVHRSTSHAALQIGETDEAAHNFAEVIQDGLNRKVVSNVLTGLIGIAWIRILKHDAPGSLALLGVVFNHPAGQDENIRGDAEPVLALLRENCTEREIQQALSLGQGLDFDTVVAGVLHGLDA